MARAGPAARRGAIVDGIRRTIRPQYKRVLRADFIAAPSR
jgi:hypothetical protein